MESQQQEKNLNCEGKSCQYLFIPFETKTFVEFRENKSELRESHNSAFMSQNSDNFYLMNSMKKT